MDKIANMLSSIQNSTKRGKSFLYLPNSKLIRNILDILYIEGYIKGYGIVSKNGQNTLDLLALSGIPFQRNSEPEKVQSVGFSKQKWENKLIVYIGNYQGSFYNDGLNQKLVRISKPGKRIYVQWKNMNKVNRGLGSLLLTTSKGILCDRDARFLNIGGEVLCQIY